MKVMQVNCVYDASSTGKIVSDIANRLDDEKIENIIIYGRGKKSLLGNTVSVSNDLISKFRKLITLFSGNKYGYGALSNRKLYGIIKRFSPDIVHLHCINGYILDVFSLLEYLASKHIPTIITLHAEFFYTANCNHSFDCDKWREDTGCNNCSNHKAANNGLFFDTTHHYWNKMKRTFACFDRDLLRLVSVSPWVMQRASASPILRSFYHKTIYNGVDTKVFCIQPKSTVEKVKIKYGIDINKTIVFHATASFEDPIKGGKYLRELAKEFEKDHRYLFVVAGNTDYSDIPSNMMCLGRISDQVELASLYSMSHVTILTSKKETFSMICAESLCCGTKLIGFEAGAPELIALPEYSTFVEQGDVEALKKAFLQTVNDDYDAREIEHEAHSVYSRELMADNYINEYRGMINEL